MIRRMDLVSEFSQIIEFVTSKKRPVRLKEICSISPYEGYENQKRWANYRVQEMVKMGYLERVTHGLYRKTGNTCSFKKHSHLRVECLRTGKEWSGELVFIIKAFHNVRTSELKRFFKLDPDVDSYKRVAPVIKCRLDRLVIKTNRSYLIVPLNQKRFAFRDLQQQ